jgi:hypothetical protein
LMEIVTLGAFLASAQSLPLRKLTHIDSMCNKILCLNKKEKGDNSHLKYMGVVPLLHGAIEIRLVAKISAF